MCSVGQQCLKVPQSRTPLPSLSFTQYSAEQYFYLCFFCSFNYVDSKMTCAWQQLYPIRPTQYSEGRSFIFQQLDTIEVATIQGVWILWMTAYLYGFLSLWAYCCLVMFMQGTIRKILPPLLFFRQCLEPRQCELKLQTHIQLEVVITSFTPIARLSYFYRGSKCSLNIVFFKPFNYSIMISPFLNKKSQLYGFCRHFIFCFPNQMAEKPRCTILHLKVVCLHHAHNT